MIKVSIKSINNY